MFGKLFGEKYRNKEDLFKTLYCRILFLRGAVLDFPLLIVACYFMPWEKYYNSHYVQSLIDFMKKNVKSIELNAINSDFPEYAIAFLSVIHFVGFLSLILPFLFISKSDFFSVYIKKRKENPIKLVIFGIISIIIFLLGQLYIGAGSYFGCEDCSYHSKLSLVMGAIVTWICIQYFLAFTLIIAKSSFLKLTSWSK